MMELQIMHVSDGNRTVEIFSRPAVPQTNLAVTGNGNALPHLSVVSVLIQILHHLRKQFFLMLCLELLPLQIDIIIGQIQSIHNIILICTVKHRRGHIESKRPGRQGQMNLQHLPDVHTGRHAQRIQHNIQRTAVGQIRHVFHRQYTRNHTLISMAARHLVAYGNLPLLRNIDTDSLVHAGRKFVAVLSGKHFRIHHNTILSMGHLQGGITDLSCLLSEDGTQQPLFRGQLGLPLGCHLTYQYITGTYLCTNTYNTSVIQIF